MRVAGLSSATEANDITVQIEGGPSVTVTRVDAAAGVIDFSLHDQALSDIRPGRVMGDLMVSLADGTRSPDLASSEDPSGPWDKPVVTGMSPVMAIPGVTTVTLRGSFSENVHRVRVEGKDAEEVAKNDHYYRFRTPPGLRDGTALVVVVWANDKAPILCGFLTISNERGAEDSATVGSGAADLLPGGAGDPPVITGMRPMVAAPGKTVVKLIGRDLLNIDHIKVHGVWTESDLFSETEWSFLTPEVLARDKVHGAVKVRAYYGPPGEWEDHVVDCPDLVIER